MSLLYCLSEGRVDAFLVECEAERGQNISPKRGRPLQVTIQDILRGKSRFYPMGKLDLPLNADTPIADLIRVLT